MRRTIIATLIFAAAMLSTMAHGQDDHGNTRAAATTVAFPSSTSARINTASDEDYFSFTLSAQTTLAISEGRNLIDTEAWLYDSNGTQLATNNQSGGGDAFLIARTLNAGTYYVRVNSNFNETGEYSLLLYETADNHGGTRAAATSVALNSDTSGAIYPLNDADYFSFTVLTAGSVTIQTTGLADTFGQLYNASGTQLASNDDSGNLLNFLITQTLSAATYYVRVTSYNSSRVGSYTLQIRGPNSAPSFGMGSVTNKTYVANLAIDEFVVPAASGGDGTITYAASNLPTGLIFDATGTDSGGCPGTEAREICGTPTTAASAATVTITAQDGDGDQGAGDRATLTFTVTVTANTAPSFGSGSVTNKTYVANSAINEFQVPAASGGNGTITYQASGLPTGLVFDATGTDSGGCPGNQAREICGTPTTAASAVTVTITAQDGDGDQTSGDRATLTFTVTVTANTAPSFGSGSVTNKTYVANSAIDEFQVPAASGGNGTITYQASGLPTGLVFDATGTDAGGCPGNQAREICGTPTTAASAVTVTITAQDGDGDQTSGDRATLTFTVTVDANLVPSFGSGSVTAKTYVAGQAITAFTVPAASGGNGTITYAASNLPDGLVFDATGSDSPGCPGNQARRVCGTPTTAAAAATVTITAQDGDANMAAGDRGLLTFSVTVETDSAPSFGVGASVTNKTYIAGLAIADFTVPAASGGNGTLTYTASNLPDGLVFDATGTDTPGCTGTEAREICGTPTTAAAAATVTITAQDADSDRTATDRATLTFTVTVNAATAPSFGSGSVTNKTYVAGLAISAFTVPAASGGNGAITYAASNLPDGLVFDATGSDSPGCTGNQARRVCGTPTTAAAATVTITAQDADSDRTSGDRATLTFTVTVETNSAPSFGAGASVTNKTYVAGQAITAFTVPAASGGNGAITYAASNLPDGLVFDATGTDATGCPGTQARRVCGTPTTAAAAATVTITAQDEDGDQGTGDRATLTFDVTVETDSAPSFGMGSVTDRIVGVNVAIQDFQVPAATGGNGTITYVASGLPAGLVFDATGSDTPGCTGTEPREVCGTPTVLGGPTTVTITARDSDANAMNTDRATLTFTITVSSDAPPSFGSGSVPEKAFILNAAITDFQVPAASGGNGTITYTTSTLPTGLVFDATGTDSGGCTGTEAREFCGTPSVAGMGTITITADDGDTNMAPGDRATLSFAYSVAADSAPTFGSGSVSNKTYPAGAAITDFVVPAASGGNGTLSYAASNLPSGLVFDATGTDTPGCAGTEAREVCGTPDAATAGAVTVTITATDLDTNMLGTDSATLTFTVTVNAGASLASSPGTLTEANLNGASLTVTLIGATYASGVGASSFQLVTNPTIAGLSIGSVSAVTSGSTTATLSLATGAGYDFDVASTVAVTVLAAAHSGANNITTGTLPVTPTPPAVLVSRRSLSLNEDPGAGTANRGTYTLALSEEPTGCTGGVGVSVAGGNPDLTVDPTALAFSTTTWNTPQTVTVTAGQDDDSETESVTLRHSIGTACAAAGYPATLAIPSVQVTVADDDAPPLPNEPPVAVGSVDDVDLALGATARVPLAGLFTDEEPELLTYAVSSSNPAVVAARLAWPAVAVEGVGHGGATVTVTATDPEGLSASLSFEVRSGVTVSFAADASAPEGGTIRLTLTASRPVPAALAVPYLLASGPDPADAADSSDRGGGAGGTATFAAGATRAEIAVPILDDDVVEPLREHFTATLAEPAEDAGYGLGLKAEATATIDEGVCDRDPAVRDELRRARPCEAVADLSRWTSLRLRDAGGAPLTLTARPEPVPDGRCEQGLVDVPCFSGFATVAGEPLTLYKVPPRTTTLPEQALDGDALRLPLAERFNAAPGEAFTYAAQSSDPSVASVRVEAGVLVVEAEGDGVATVTVTATDAHGQMGTLAFTVRATLPMRGGLRGWRLILIEAPPDA